MKIADTKDGFFSLLDFMPNEVFVLDKNLDVIFWNSEIEKNTGIPREDILDTNIGEKYPQFKETSYLKKIKKTLSGGPPIHFSSKIQGLIFPEHQNATVNHREMTVSAIKVGKSSSLNALFVIKEEPRLENNPSDISEAEKSVTEIDESELRLFRQLIDDSSDAVFVIDPSSGRFLDVNDEATKSLDYTKAELLNMTIMDVETKFSGDASLWRSHVENIKKKGKVVITGAEKRHDSTLFPVERGVSYLELGDKEYIVTFVRDISERRVVEEKLQESERRFRETTDLLPQTIFELDTDSNFTFVNRFGLDSVGYSKADLEKGVNAIELFAPEDKARAAVNIEKLLKGLKDGNHEYTILRKDKSRFPVLVLSSPITRDGEITGVRGVVHDMTEVKEYEEGIKVAYEQQRVLNDILTVSFSEVSLGTILKSVLDKILDMNSLSALKSGAVFLVSEDEEHFELTAHKGLPQKMQREVARLSVNECICGGRAVENKDHEFAECIEGSLARKLEISKNNSPRCAHYCVPIKFGERLLGVINLFAENGYEKKKADLEFLVSVATTLAGVVIRKRVVGDLKDSQERLELALHGANLGIWDWNIKTGKFIFDDRWSGMLGYAGGELGENYATLERLVHPDDLSSVERALETHIEGKTPYYESEHRMMTRSEKWIWVLDRGRVVERDKDGNPLRATGTHLDISDRKIAEDRLRSINECFIAFTPDPIENINSITELCGRLLSATSALYNRREGEDLFALGTWNVPHGYEVWDKAKGHICNEIIEKSIEGVFCVRNIPATIYSENDCNLKKYGFKTYVGHGVKVRGQYQGSLCTIFKDDFIPTSNDKRLFGILASAVGVEEERALAEDELKKAKNIAEAAMRAKSDFLATMSHEIRTPVTAITGVTELLKETQLSEDQSRFLDVTISASETLLSVINDVLDFSRVESGLLKLEYATFNLRTLASKVIDVVEVKGAQKGLTLALHIDINVPDFIVGDGGRVSAVLLNLLGNAVKFTDKGSVSLFISKSQKEREGIVELDFHVKDTGIGITEDKLEHIFDRFTQADTSTSRKYGGSGLGLSISKRLTQLMGGEIRVKSEIGVGSDFSFTANFELGFEKDALAEEKPEEKDKGIPPLKKKPSGVYQEKSILLAEDAEHLRFIMHNFLETLLCKIDIAENGIKAFELFSKNKYDLVLMDMEMPEMDGYEATEKIRELEEKTGRVATPVVALTAHIGEESARRCISAGCNEHIAKPIKKDRLLELVGRYFNVSCNKDKKNDGETIFVKIDPDLKDAAKWYITDMTKDVVELRAALKDSDYEALRTLGHRMKGTGGTFGFDEITEIGKGIEDFIEGENKEDTETLRGFVDRLANYIENVKML